MEDSLTELGCTLEEPIRMLTAWARDHGETIADLQEAAGKKNTSKE